MHLTLKREGVNEGRMDLLYLLKARHK